MTGHRVRAKKELDMENQSKLEKYLVERTIKEISTGFTTIKEISTICSYDDNITAILKSGVIFFLFFFEENLTPVAFSNFQPL